jgi:hypothetical protein
MDLAYCEMKNPGRDMVIAGADMNAAGREVKNAGREVKPPNGILRYGAIVPYETEAGGRLLRTGCDADRRGGEERG